MSYTELNSVEIVGGQSLTGYSLTNSVTESGNQISTTIIYFDANFNEVGQKFIDHQNNITNTVLRVYADEAAVLSQDYTEYGASTTKNSSDVVTDQLTWEFTFAGDVFQGGTETEGLDSEAKVTITLKSDWSIDESQTTATLGTGAGTSITPTGDASAWAELPAQFTSGATEITIITDSDTGIYTYYDTTSGVELVGTKNTFSWDNGGVTATGYSYHNTKGDMLGDGGNNGNAAWSNLREVVAATGSASDKNAGEPYVVEKGSFEQFDTDGVTVLYAESWEYEYAGAGHSTLSEGAFLGGSETRNGETVTYNQNWEIVSKATSFSSTPDTLGSSEFAALINDNGDTAGDTSDDFVFQYFDADDLALAVAETFKTTLVAKGIVTSANYASDKRSDLLAEVQAGVYFVSKGSDSDSWAEGSWSNKRLNLIIEDDNGTASDTSDDTFKTLGKMDLNLDTWIETWNDNKSQSAEGYNFNTSGNEWLGGGNISGDGWAWQNTRVEYAAGTVSGAKVDTAKFTLSEVSTGVYSAVNADGDTLTTDANGYLLYQDANGNDIAYYTEVNKNGSYDSVTGEVVWDFTSARDYAYQDNGDFWGEYLGGYDLDGGSKVSFDENWQEIGREVNTDSLKALASSAVIPDFVAGATHASYKTYNQDYPEKSDLDQTDAALLESYDLFYAEGPQNGEIQYYKLESNGTYTPLGKVNNWSWFNEGDGNWGVGSNYDKYDDTNGDWPWQWVGGENTHYWDGNVDEWSQVRIDNGDGTYTEKGSNVNQWEDFSYESLFSSATQIISGETFNNGDYISGTETRDGETTVFGAHRAFVSSSKKIEFQVGSEPSLSNNLANELDDPQNDFVFSHFDAQDVILKIANTYKTALVDAGAATASNYDASDAVKTAALITEVGDAVLLEVKHVNSDNFGDNSWSNKELELLVDDGNGGYKAIGYVNLDANKWIETWNNNQEMSSENIHFNSTNWQWLGNSGIDSKGFANETTREIFAANSEGNTYTGDLDDDDTTSASDKIAYLRQTNKFGEVQGDGSVTWSETRVEDWVYSSDGMQGRFLGGYEIRNGQKTTWDENWNITSQEVDASSLVLLELTAAEKTALPASFSEATHKQVNYYDQDNLGKVVSRQDGSTVTLPGDGEALYFKSAPGSDPVLVGREMFHSWVDDFSGEWDYGRNFDVVGSASGGENWDWAGNFREDSRGGSLDVSYGVNSDSAGAFAERGSRTDAWYEDGLLKTETESWVYYYDATEKFIGGYEINEDGLRVNLDENRNPTGELVAADGTELSIFSMLQVDAWTSASAEFQAWEANFLVNGSAEDIKSYNELPDAASRDLAFKGAIFEEMNADFGVSLRSDPVLDQDYNLVGIQMVGSNYVFEVTGDLITEMLPGATEPDVVGGIVHSGKLYRIDGGGNYIELADGSNDFELPATFFGSILEAFGVFDGAELKKNWAEQRLEVYGLPTGVTAADLKLELFDGQNDDYQIVAVGDAAGFKAQSDGSVHIAFSDIKDAIADKLAGASQIDLRSHDETVVTYYDSSQAKTVEVGDRENDNAWLPIVRADETNKVIFIELVPDHVAELKLELRDTKGTPENNHDDHWEIIGQGAAGGFEMVGASLNGYNTWKISFDKVNAAIKQKADGDTNFSITDYDLVSMTYQDGYNTKHHGSMDRLDALKGTNDPISVELVSGDVVITFDDETTSVSDMSKLFVDGQAVDMHSSDNIFYDKSVTGAEIFAEIAYAPDTTPPTVVITVSDNSLSSGETATVTFTFSEEVKDFTLADVGVSGGTLTEPSKDGSDAKIYTSTFTPNSNENGSASITVTAGNYTDLSDNAGTGGAAVSIAYDTTTTQSGPSEPIHVGSDDTSATAGKLIIELKSLMDTSVTAYDATDAAAAISKLAIKDETTNTDVVLNFTGSVNATFTASDGSKPAFITLDADLTHKYGISYDSAGDGLGANNSDNDETDDFFTHYMPPVELKAEAGNLEIALNDIPSSVMDGSAVTSKFELQESGGTAVTLDFTPSTGNATFTAAVEPSAGNSYTGSPAKVVVTGLTLSNDYKVIYDANENGLGSPNAADDLTFTYTGAVQPLAAAQTQSLSISLSELSNGTHQIVVNNWTGSETDLESALELYTKDASGAVSYLNLAPIDFIVDGAISGKFSSEIDLQNHLSAYVTKVGAFIDSDADNVLDAGTVQKPKVVLKSLDLSNDIVVSYDVNGTSGDTSDDFTYTYYAPDTTPPTVVITVSDNDLSAGETTTVTFTFSEEVKDFTLADIGVTAGSLTEPVKDGVNAKIYTSTYTPSSNDSGSASITVTAGNYTDLSDNAGTSGAAVSIAYDTTPPTVVITVSDNSLSSGETATVTFTFSEEVKDFTLADVGVSGGTLTEPSKDGSDAKIYTSTFTPTANSQGTASITIAADTYQDAAGNNGLAGTTPALTYNTTTASASPVMTAKFLEGDIVISINDNTITETQFEQSVKLGGTLVSGGIFTAAVTTVGSEAPAKYVIKDYQFSSNSVDVGYDNQTTGVTSDDVTVTIASPFTGESAGVAGRVKLHTVDVNEYENGAYLGELEWTGTNLTASDVSFTLPSASDVFPFGTLRVDGTSLYLGDNYHFVKDGAESKILKYTLTPSADGYSSYLATGTSDQGATVKLGYIEAVGTGLSDGDNNNWDQFDLSFTDVSENITLTSKSFNAYEVGATFATISSTVNSQSFGLMNNQMFEVSGNELKLKGDLYYDPELVKVVSKIDGSMYSITDYQTINIISYESSSASDVDYIQSVLIKPAFSAVTTAANSSMPFYAGTPTVEVALPSDSNLKAMFEETPSSSGKTQAWKSNPNYTQSSAGETIITYSFVADGGTNFISNYNTPTPGTNSIEALSEQEENSVKQALSEFEEIANIKFIEVNETGDIVGTLRFGATNAPNGDAAAWATPPTISPVGGDIWLSSGLDAYNSNYTQGSGYGFATLLHEIGHALGLKHPFEDPKIATNLDNTKYTLMSYTSDTLASTGNTSSADDGTNYIISSTPMIYDIAAVQHLYGAAENNNDATTYSFNSTSPEAKTIWDTGGIDTFDLSNVTTDAIVDLNQGESSTIKTDTWTLTDNIGIAFNTTIENIIAGSGDDQFTLNNAANICTFNSGFGSDEIIGFEKNVDKLIFKNTLGEDVASGDITASNNSGSLQLASASDVLILTGIAYDDYNYDVFFV